MRCNIWSSPRVVPALESYQGIKVIFDYFDEIRIINLAARKDRRAKMRSELRRVGIADDPRVEFFDAISFPDAGSFSSPGARGVYHSQLAILDQAAKRGHSVLIIEDDVDFVEGAENFVPAEGWAIFYGGYYADDSHNLHTSDIVGAHMMGFRAAIVPVVADYLRSISFDGIHPPIDGAYVWFRRAHPEVSTLFARPPLGHQRPSRSDIADLQFYDKLPVFRQGAAAARSVKRSIKNIFRPSLAN